MTIERMWVSIEHTVEALIDARKAGVDLGTVLTPGPGIVVVLATDHRVQSTFADALRNAAVGTGFPNDPDGTYRGYGRADPYSVRAEGRGTRPGLVCDLGAFLHREAVRERLDAIRNSGQQTFITTMNPTVLDMLEFADAEQWRRGFIFVDAAGARHMTAEDAAECARSYAVGIQHVSEILEAGGLW